MKKSIVRLLLLVFAVSFFNGFTVSAVAEDLTDEQKTLLQITGVYDEKMATEDQLTKAEFAGMLAKVAFSLNEDLKNRASDISLPDVSSGNTYKDSIMALYGAGYLKVDKFGCYHPGDFITKEEAVELVLNVMGYNSKVIPASYGKLEFAEVKGLLKNAWGDKVTAQLAYNLIYNMLKCDITDLKLREYDDSDDEMVYMSRRLRVYEKKGIVTDDGEMSLYGDTTIGEGYVSIDGKEAALNQTGRNDLLGLNVCAYYLAERNGIEREYTMIGVVERNSKNNITIISSDNLNDYKDRTYYYNSDKYSSKERKIRIPNDAVIIYNNRTLRLSDNLNVSKFKPQNGFVKLYDNDNDGEINIVKIEEYSTFIVSSVNAAKKIIYFENEKDSLLNGTDGRTFLSLEYKKYSIKDAEENDIKLESVPVKSVCSVMSSLDGEYYTIVVSSYKAEETVRSVSDATDTERMYVVTGTDGIYTFSDYAKDNFKKPEPGISYIFYFDMFDHVAKFEKSEMNVEKQFGYLACIKPNDESGDDTYIAKIFTQIGEFEFFNLSNKVKLLDENDKLSSLKAQVLFDTLKSIKNQGADSDTVVYNGIIRFKINEKQEISYIELPHKYGEKPNTEDRLFYLLDTIEKEDKSSYYMRLDTYSKMVNFGGVGVVGKNTTIFQTPADRGEYGDYELIDPSLFTSSISPYEKYAVCLYGTNYKEMVAAVACIEKTKDDSKKIVNYYTETVTKVEFVYDEDEGEPIYRIYTVNHTGEAKTYKMTQDLYENNVKCIAKGNTNPVKISTGDAIYLKADWNNFITNAVLAYDADGEVIDEYGNKIKGGIAGAKYSYYAESEPGLGSPFGSNEEYAAGMQPSADPLKFGASTVRLVCGWVYSYQDGCMVVTTQNPANGYKHDVSKDSKFINEAQILYLPYSTTMTVGGKNKVEVKKSAESDIKPYTVYGENCSRIFLTMRQYDPRTFLIINDE